uniref:Uncharacterized protein n=1 Tax=Arundo donax TaxID=35708 RepID=A0A0A9EH21_ARUDO
MDRAQCFFPFVSRLS